MIYMEEWKQIVIDGETYPYEVSTEGRVRRIKTEHIRKQQIGTSGYYKLNLSKKGIKRTFRVHRLVAIMFLPNPNNYDSVDHIDHNRLNNCVSNLRWMPLRDNSLDGIDMVKRRVRCIETGKEYDSITEASKDTGVNISRIHNLCTGKTKGKFKWSKTKDLHFEYIN